MCGVFGIVSNADVIQKIVLGLYDLQHRGEQAVGVVVSNGIELQCQREIGLVTEVFNERDREERFRQLPGRFGVGHTLYSTIGREGDKKQPRTFQPLIGDFNGQPFALCHNGNLIDLEELRKEAEEKGYKFHSETSDTEVIVALISTCPEKDFLSSLLNVLPRLKGAFVLIILFKDKVIGIRDRYGIRPLCLGRDDKSFMLASESCAFYTEGADFIRDIKPGEVIILGKHGIESSFIWAQNPQLKFCIFEYVYFARPDSRLNGQDVYFYRENAGRFLAEEHPVEADIIIPVPESGRIYDNSFSETSKIPLREGLFRSRYFSTKTFLTPRETNRRHLQTKKIHPLRKVVHEKRVCVIEDSIVRASVSPEVVAMLRRAGASEVHLRVGSSPLCHPCFLGIDIPSQCELIASTLNVEEIRKVIQADTLGYLSLEAMIKASGLPKENLCLGCFNGEYPIEPPKELNLKSPS